MDARRATRRSKSLIFDRSGMCARTVSGALEHAKGAVLRALLGETTLSSHTSALGAPEMYSEHVIHFYRI